MAQNVTLTERLALAVASGESVTAAAESVGCSRRHAHRLLAKDACRNRIAELRTLAADEAVGRLSAGAVHAVDRLNALLDHDEPNVQLQAAKAMLSLLPKVADHCELRVRLARIENR